MIKDDEICRGSKSRYYNLRRFASGYYSLSDEERLSVADSIKRTLNRPEIKEKHVRRIRETLHLNRGLFKKGHTTWNAGSAGTGLMRAWNKGATGVSEETSRRMSESARARGPGPSQRGRIWVNDGTRNIKLPVGVTKIPNGFKRGMMPKPSRWDRVNTPNEETTT